MANKTFIAGEDLTGKVGYAVKYDAGIKVGAGFGVLMNDGINGAPVGVALTGDIVPVKAGGAIKVGDALKVNANGKLIAGTEETDVIIARALEAGVADALVQAVIV